MRPLLTASVLALSLLTGCIHSDTPSPSARVNRAPDPSAPATLAEKQALVSLMDFYYLWPETLPANPDLAAARTLPELMDQLTAPARRLGLDRGWSRVWRVPATHTASAGAGPQVLPGMAYGLGFSAVLRDGRAWVAYVPSGSDPARLGVSRGDELVAAAATRADLDQPGNQGSRLFAPDLASRKTAVALLGPDGPATIQLRLRKPGGPGTNDLAITRTLFPADLVPEANRAVILHQDAERRVGYLQLRAFEAEANSELRRACARLGRAGVTDLVVDLRYNGGGLIDTAELLVNLLRGGAPATDVMWQMTHNSKRPPAAITRFSTQPESLRLRRIAFIVTEDTASSSEMVVNALAPHLRADLAIVGSRTHGKPVGMEFLFLPDHPWVVQPISLRNLNAAGFSHFTQGLPDVHYQGVAWTAEDDLAHAQNDPAEASNATALRWILGGTANLQPIPPPPAPAQASALPDPADDDQAEPSSPYRGQDPNRPGLL